ncbi:hypothetical protein P7K49_003295 [Saguinus oedipus]|uniref:Uncharacterized protein n=1 Tax=Saguinus oedipus TaxID=9490 RepID=A0ABQ9WJS0_SAGOE|nr:hypothetical protein P7K49_003295 [Saguinus oedipus]
MHPLAQGLKTEEEALRKVRAVGAVCSIPTLPRQQPLRPPGQGTEQASMLGPGCPLTEVQA